MLRSIAIRGYSAATFEMAEIANSSASPLQKNKNHLQFGNACLVALQHSEHKPYAEGKAKRLHGIIADINIKLG